MGSIDSAEAYVAEPEMAKPYTAYHYDRATYEQMHEMAGMYAAPGKINLQQPLLVDEGKPAKKVKTSGTGGGILARFLSSRG